MTNPPSIKLELEDIKSGVLRPRSDPYVGTYIGLRIDDRKAGRYLMRRAPGVPAGGQFRPFRQRRWRRK